jgi:hypothetical protein
MRVPYAQKNSQQKAADLADKLQDFLKTLGSDVMLIITPDKKRVLERAGKILRRASGDPRRR